MKIINVRIEKIGSDFRLFKQFHENGQTSFLIVKDKDFGDYCDKVLSKLDPNYK